MSKKTLYGKSAREALMAGVDFLVDAVALTEGPRGRNCILGQRALGQTPKCTRDGVTVANYVDPSDPTLQMGADLVREACQKTDNSVGDGTTCTAVLAKAMVHTGFDFIDQQQINPFAIERGIHNAVNLVIDYLKAQSIEVSDEKVFQVATVSAHGDTEIGRLVSDAIKKAGRDGIVTAEPSTTSETHVESVAGLELPKSSLLHTAFITHPEDMKAELHDCRVLLWEGVIATAKSLVPILQQVHDGGQPLIIIAGGYEQEALSVLIKNKVKLALPLIAVRMEAYGERRKEVMRDIAALTGGKAYTEDMGTKIETVKLAELGQARKVVTTMSKTQIIDGRGRQEELLGRIKLIRELMETADPETKKSLRSRLAALTGGITVIKVGGVTVTEMEEKKDRVVDAMSAAKAAVESGIVAGGGTALFRSVSVISASHLNLPDEERAGFAVVRSACQSVVRQISENSGVEGDETIRILSHNDGYQSPTIGYNARTGLFTDLIEDGVIDPTAVVIEALRNAAAVSCSILTTGALVSEILRQEQPNA